MNTQKLTSDRQSIETQQRTVQTLRKIERKTEIQEDNRKRKRKLQTGMSTDSNTGIQTRAVAQHIDNETNAEQLQGAPNPDMNPGVELHKTKEDAIKEFV